MLKIGSNNQGFSLIEILVVLAISVIMMGLVLGPVSQSFRMTRQAQAMADAQDAARQAMELISRDLGEAMFVFDNAVTPINIYNDGGTPGYVFRSGEEGPIQLPVRQPNGSVEYFTLPHAKIDFILPKMSMHCNNPEHPENEPRDYQRGNEAWPPCPVCGSTDVDARPKFPLEQDVTVVRYFLGLRYNDPRRLPALMAPPPEDKIFGWKSPYANDTEVGAENQVVLYRVEFDPHDDSLFPSGMPVSERLKDPIFFYRSAPNAQGRPCCDVWMERARVIGMGKYQDLVVGTFASDGTVTAVEPTVTFQFTAIDNDTFAGTYTHDRNFEYPDAVPAVYRAAYGYWTSPEGVTVYRYGQNQTDAFTTEYVTVNNTPHLMIVRRSSANGWNPVNEFDITQYLTDLENNNLNSITRPDGSGEPPAIAFWIDYVTVPDPSDPSKKVIVFTPNRGNVYFTMIPPKVSGGKYGPVTLLDPAAINAEFHNTYSTNRGSAQRMASLNVPQGARIVPGSDKVIGPNMTPGQGYGQDVLYERIPIGLGDPGLNQYKIDYDTGAIYFSSVFDHDLPEIPDGNGVKPIKVDYKIQFNKKDDVVKGDYTTKSLVTVHLGMRMFDPDTGKPHSVDLTNSIKVRNALR